MPIESLFDRTVRSRRFIVWCFLLIILSGVIYSNIVSRHASENALEAANEAKASNTQLLKNSQEATRQRRRLIKLQTTINGCLNPKKPCAKQGQKQSQGLLAATIVCQKQLPSTATKMQALACVRRVILEP